MKQMMANDVSLKGTVKIPIQYLARSITVKDCVVT